VIAVAAVCSKKADIDYDIEVADSLYISVPVDKNEVFDLSPGKMEKILRFLTKMKAKLGDRLEFSQRSSEKINNNRDQEAHDLAYQFLERSKIPTMHFQDGLPRLPIPKLKYTCQNYLNGIRPFLNDEQFDAAKKLVDDFRHSSGERLNRELILWYRRNKHTSYIAEPWFDMYFRYRAALPINQNPFLVWKPYNESFNNDQLSVATNIVISACRFKRSLDYNCLQPEVYHLYPNKSNTPFFRNICSRLPGKLAWLIAFLMKAFPLDMSQYSFLFNTTRIPVMIKDQLNTNRSSKCIIVLRRGYFYSLTVFRKDGSLISPAEIHASLEYILKDNRPVAENPIGLLTTVGREQWSLLRSQLLMIDGNERSLLTIDGGLFVLNLDELQSVDPETVGKSFLHGDGINSLNAWIKPGQPTDASIDCSEFVEKLEFKLTKPIEEAIKVAGETYREWCDSLMLRTLQYQAMNRKYLKEKNLSPDAIMQTAIQVAFYRLHSKFVPTYESCSTAAFKHGRTEAVRPATMASNEFVQALLGSERNFAQLRILLEACSKQHSLLVKQAAMGKGFDRHLFAMKVLAERRGDRLPDLFIDDTYRTANHFTLSTSSLFSDVILLGGFGPVVHDGYGIGYSITDEQLGFLVTTYRLKRNAQQFCTSLEQSLNDILWRKCWLLDELYLKIAACLIEPMQSVETAHLLKMMMQQKTILKPLSHHGKNNGRLWTPKKAWNESLASQYYITEEGKSMRTSVTTVQATMDETYLCIAAYNNYGFRLSNQTQVIGPMIVFPQAALSWKVNLVLIGAGNSEDVAQPDACPLFNYMNADGRFVIALLFPVRKMPKAGLIALTSNFDRALAHEMDSDVLATLAGVKAKSIPHAVQQLAFDWKKQQDEQKEIENILKSKK
ncbi:Choline/Carnitine O-acyltransferase, partial [Trichinella nativa]